ncbi:hypothetical protein DFH08DRAFT_337326 [Mycena albidolilacea]|uniref:Uncharacterized protein n=1 Tax=Mycena albidolilacea TaxID=1033008 RepID=A0AAD7EIE8_9AGAR|nr:hypothetical protein DFH08DRAFT_337326 [Mycena albidolilacea]
MPSLVSALPSLNPPSFPTLVSTSNAVSYSSFAFATPTNAALVLGLTASLVTAFAVHRIRRAGLADCEAVTKTTAVGLARRASIVPVPQEELGFHHFFTCIDEDNEIDTADVFPWWFINDPLSRGPYPLATPKSTVAAANVRLTAGDLHTSFTADVEHAPEVLDLSHLFATLVTKEDADTNDEEEDLDYSYWAISRSVAEIPIQEVVAFLPSLTGAPVQEVFTAEVEHDHLGFGYLFSAALEEEEEEEDDAVAHDLDEVSGYPIVSALDAIRIQTPSTVAILQVHSVTSATPTETSGSRHVAFRPGKGHTVSLRAPPRSSSAVLAPHSPLAKPDIKFKRASSLKRFAAAFKRDHHSDKDKEEKEKEKENVKPKANGKAPGRVARRILA